MNEEIVKKFVNALISLQVAQHYLEELKHTKLYQKELKKRINLTLAELRKNEKVFDIIQNEAENATDDVHDAYFEFISASTSIPFHELKNAATVLQAYLTDPKRIEQIAKKILIRRGLIEE